LYTRPAPPPAPPGLPLIPPEKEQPSIPPIIDPARWEDFAVFRETFLLYFTEPPSNTALRIFGRLFHELVLEYYHHWPNWPEGLPRRSYAPCSPTSDTSKAISPP
jgi:hypothetical protein